MNCEVCNTITKNKWKEFTVCQTCLTGAKEIMPQMQKMIVKNGITWDKVTLRDAVRQLKRGADSLRAAAQPIPIDKSEINITD